MGKMYEISGGSPEAVALELMTKIAECEGKIIGPPGSHLPPYTSADRKWVLNTYAECLAVVTATRDWEFDPAKMSDAQLGKVINALEQHGIRVDRRMIQPPSPSNLGRDKGDKLPPPRDQDAGDLRSVIHRMRHGSADTGTPSQLAKLEQQ